MMGFRGVSGVSGFGEFVWVADRIQNVWDVFMGKNYIELCVFV